MSAATPSNVKNTESFSNANYQRSLSGEDGKLLFNIFEQNSSSQDNAKVVCRSLPPLPSRPPTVPKRTNPPAVPPRSPLPPPLPVTIRNKVPSVVSQPLQATYDNIATQIRNKLPPPPTGPPPDVPVKQPIKQNIPPPLVATMPASLQKSTSSSRISLRQDSSVSSDSFSQTSSPSYTTKTMETPLLPHHTPKICNGKIYSKLTGSKAQGADSSTNGSSLTKSVSTPASLQTIVRFHNDSNMSLHHRVSLIMRDIRRPSSHYVHQVRLKFRFVQLAINALALLAIGGGLAAYFKGQPSRAPETDHNATVIVKLPAISPNPAPGICLPVIVHFCQYYKVPYNFTVFPNYVGHFGQPDAEQELEVYDAVVDVRCYELAALFLCSVFVPKCGPLGQMVRPCRSLCSQTKRRCGFFLDVFGLTLPDYLDCAFFPESDNPDVCVGHEEVNRAKERAQKPQCVTGFQCDGTRCIPMDWRCDGHIDCEDQKDELNCVHCPNGTIHCGDDRCMAQQHQCDGKIDCPWAQDERNCLRLSQANGDIACADGWDPDTYPNAICSLLGYSNSTFSALSNINEDHIAHLKNQSRNGRNPRTRQTNLLRKFSSCPGMSYPKVELTCTNYVCGKVRKSYAESRNRLRIVGGVKSKPGDWPFLAALLGGPEKVFYCAGVLIADQWVLTASHCVGNHSNVTGWTIQLGLTRRHAHSYYGQKMKVKRVVPHPLYNLGVAHDNDIALLQLASKVNFNEHLLPVCLPQPNEELRPGTVCTVIGWGKKEDKDVSEYEPEINEVQVPVLNRDLCNSWLINKDLNVTEGMICAGYKEGGKDACQGDSGGPLLCRDDRDKERWFVGGIVSWGIKCAHPHLPGVYAYVPKYIPWIKQQMALYSDTI